MVESKYELNQAAYVKLVLHALKHKTSAVNGILVGKISDKTESVEIIDAIPLSHGHLGLLPTLEIAIIQESLSFIGFQISSAVSLVFVKGKYKMSIKSELDKFPRGRKQTAEEHFTSKGDGLCIVGYYHANERYEDLDLNSLAKKIGDHISRYFPQVAILLLNNKLLEELPKGGSKKPVVQ